MGAIDGSWAGLHGPGEKTIEKTGQLGPGLYKELEAQRGPRSRGYSTASERVRPGRHQPYDNGNWGPGAREKGCTVDISRGYTCSCQRVSGVG